MILVDANIWIYFLDDAFDEHPAVRRNLPKALTDTDALIPAIVQLEVLHYVARQMGDEAERVFETFLAHPGEVAPVSGATVTDAARILLARRGMGIGGRDSALLAIARERDATIATADRALGRAARAMKIKIVNPAA